VLVTPFIEIMPLIYGGTGIGVSSIRALKMDSSSEFDLRMDVISLARSQLLEDFGAITVESSATRPFLDYGRVGRNTLGIRNVFAFHFYASLKDHTDLLHADTHSTRQRDVPQSPAFGALWRRALFQED
jgi:hypothetical protein